MKDQENRMCKFLEDYFDGELDPALEREFQIHLSVCSGCQENYEELLTVRKSLEGVRDLELPEETDLRLRNRFHREILTVAHEEEILDIEGVASLLQLPVKEIISMIDTLPSFEVAGRIRFRRDRILSWIKEQEQKHSWEQKQTSSPSKTNIISFPGGKQ